jgi:hypothetical protein
MWERVQAKDGRVYFWNTLTNRVTWNNPSRDLHDQCQTSNEMINDMHTIMQRNKLQTSVHVGLYARLNYTFNIWRLSVGNRVRALSTAIESLLETRCRMRVNEMILRNELVGMEGLMQASEKQIQSIEKALVSSKLSAATIDFDHLKARLKWV